MKKNIYIIFLLFLSVEISNAQGLSVTEIFADNHKVLLDSNNISNLNFILNSDLSIPYSVIQTGIQGTSYFKIKNDITVNVSIYRGMEYTLDSIIKQRLKSPEFIKRLTVLTDSCKFVEIHIRFERNKTSTNQINNLPLIALGKDTKNTTALHFGKLFTQRIESNYSNNQNQFYNTKHNFGNNEIVFGYREIIINDNKFNYDGNIYSIIQLSVDSTVLLTSKFSCGYPKIYTEYLITKNSLSIKSMIELYDLDLSSNNQMDSIINIVKSIDSKFLKLNYEPAFLLNEFSWNCSSAHDKVESILGIHPIGNCVGILNKNIIIYKYNIGTKIQSTFGLVEVESDKGYDIFIGGWIE